MSNTSDLWPITAHFLEEPGAISNLAAYHHPRAPAANIMWPVPRHTMGTVPILPGDVIKVADDTFSFRLIETLPRRDTKSDV
jgi:hypothetical protein